MTITYIMATVGAAGSGGSVKSSCSLSAGVELFEADCQDVDSTSLFDNDSESEGWFDSEPEGNELPRLLVRLHFSKNSHSYLSASLRDITHPRASANIFLPSVKVQVLHWYMMMFGAPFSSRLGNTLLSFY
jgi:hypothetical protein